MYMGGLQYILLTGAFVLVLFANQLNPTTGASLKLLQLATLDNSSIAASSQISNRTAASNDAIGPFEALPPTPAVLHGLLSTIGAGDSSTAVLPTDNSTAMVGAGDSSTVILPPDNSTARTASTLPALERNTTTTANGTGPGAANGTANSSVGNPLPGALSSTIGIGARHLQDAAADLEAVAEAAAASKHLPYHPQGSHLSRTSSNRRAARRLMQQAADIGNATTVASAVTLQPGNDTGNATSRSAAPPASTPGMAILVGAEAVLAGGNHSTSSSTSTSAHRLLMQSSTQLAATVEGARGESSSRGSNAWSSRQLLQPELQSLFSVPVTVTIPSGPAGAPLPATAAVAPPSPTPAAAAATEPAAGLEAAAGASPAALPAVVPPLAASNTTAGMYVYGNGTSGNVSDSATESAVAAMAATVPDNATVASGEQVLPAPATANATANSTGTGG